MGIAAENQIKCHPAAFWTVVTSRAAAVQPWRAASHSCSITQGFLYAPFGEITTEYAPMWQNSVLPKYSFNAKELDEETGMYYYEARYYNPPVFVSRDAMFEKYFWMSPYAYCANNPVKYVDPTGMDWVVTGDAADEAVRQWNNMTSSDYKLQLGEDGKISASGAPVSDIDKYLDELIRNSDITVNISASGRNTFPNGDQYDLSVDGVHYYGGAYMGTSIGEDGHVNAYQNVNPYNGKFWDEATNSPNGYCMLHEVAESYEAGKLTKKNGTGDPYKAYGYYEEAHTAAAKYAGGTIDANVIGYNIIHKIKQTPDYLKLIMGSYTVKSKSIPIYEFSFSR